MQKADFQMRKLTKATPPKTEGTYLENQVKHNYAFKTMRPFFLKLQELVHVPRTWPLVRLTPQAGLSKQIDRLLEGCWSQILAANRNPEAQVIQTATHLT